MKTESTQRNTINMAAQGELMGFSGPGGFHNEGMRETSLVGDQNLSSGTPTLEDMLKEATDLQTGRTFNGTRLELRSDEMTSPFQAPPPPMAPVPTVTPSPVTMMGSQNYTNNQPQQPRYPSVSGIIPTFLC